jgi:polyisoprenoid-binding protein YceI
MGVSTFRSSFADIAATVEADGDGTLRIAGSAGVESVAIAGGATFGLRDHVLAEDMLDAAHHPRITFIADPVRPAAAGAVLATGRLTIRGVTREVVVEGVWAGPVEDPFGNVRAALDLRTSVDRRDFGITWSSVLPGGGDVLGNDVRIEVGLELVAPGMC